MMCKIYFTVLRERHSIDTLTLECVSGVYCMVWFIPLLHVNQLLPDSVVAQGGGSCLQAVHHYAVKSTIQGKGVYIQRDTVEPGHITVSSQLSEEGAGMVSSLCPCLLLKVQLSLV